MLRTSCVLKGSLKNRVFITTSSYSALKETNNPLFKIISNNKPKWKLKALTIKRKLVFSYSIPEDLDTSNLISGDKVVIFVNSNGTVERFIAFESQTRQAVKIEYSKQIALA